MDDWRDKVAVTWEATGDAARDAALRAEAERVAGELAVAVMPTEVDTSGRLPGAEVPEVVVVVTAGRLEVRVVRGEVGVVGGRGVAPEWEKLDVTSGPGRSLQAPLLKAVGIRKGEPYRPRVLDATAGLGEDAWLLAAAGCEVVAVERNPVVAALLRDAARRAGGGRMTVVQGEARAVLEALKTGAGEGGNEGADLPAFSPSAPPDVVYLDPMFPGAAKRKTAERKAMRVLRLLAGEDEDADALLEPALAVARRRVVVKRPGKAAPLAGRAPTVTHAGRGFRFDVYAVA